MWELETSIEKPNTVWKYRLKDDDGSISFGQEMEKRVSDKPVWLSTAGGGVPWLHVRLDNRPKYYSYRPYREEDFPMSDIVSVGIFLSESQANHAKAALKESGITAQLADSDEGTFGFSIDASDQINLIVNREDYENAKKILAELEEMEEGEPAPAWTCSCGEQVDEGFAVCWSCEAQSPGTSSAVSEEE